MNHRQTEGMWRETILEMFNEGRELTNDDVGGVDFLTAVEGDDDVLQGEVSKPALYIAGFLRGLAFGANNMSVRSLIGWASTAVPSELQSNGGAE